MVFNTPKIKLCIQAHFSKKNLNIWDLSMCLTRKWPKLNSFLRKRILPPAIFELWICGLVDQSYTHCATKIDPNIWRYKLFHNMLKSPCWDVQSWQVEVTGCQWSFFFLQHNYIYSWLSGHLEQCINSFRFTLKPENG